MISRSLEEIYQMAGGTQLLLNGAEPFQEIRGVSIDSRTIQTGNLFVPIVRIQDGHLYADQAMEKGASASLWQIDHGPPPAGRPVILVKNTLTALHHLARSYRDQLHCKIIGVTGSNGKTTVKDMVSSILSTQYKVHKTFGNLNGEYGLPLTILEIEEDTEAAVLEMGMSSKGEISTLAKIARPDVGIITMIGVSHLSQLGSREGIAQAKLEILDGLNPEGTFIFHGDESLLTEELAKRQLPETLKLITFGDSHTNDYYPASIDSTSSGLQFVCNKYTDVFHLPLLGRHNILNALASIAAVESLHIDKANLRAGLENVFLSSMRMEQIRSSKGFLIINDAWNASPVSMKAAMETVQQMQGYHRIVFILGDMLELGVEETSFHEEAARWIDRSKVHAVFTYGEISKVITDTLLSEGFSGYAGHFTSKAKLASQCLELLGPQDIVLIKGSRGLKLEEVCTMLK